MAGKYYENAQVLSLVIAMKKKTEGKKEVEILGVEVD